MQYNLVPLAKSNLVQTGRPEPPCMVALKDETLRLLRDANMDVVLLVHMFCDIHE